MLYSDKLVQLISSNASDDEIIDCVCKVWPREILPNVLEGFVEIFLEGREDELVWRVLHADEDIAYGAACFWAWKHGLLNLFFKEFDLAKARVRLTQLGWFS